MVAVMKPLVRRPATDVEFLQKVRALIERGEERFICNAIAQVGRRFGTPDQITMIADEVRRRICPYSYYTMYATATYPKETLTDGWQVRGRLALIDSMIYKARQGEIQNG